MKWSSLLFIALFILLSGCGLKEREKALAERERKVAAREQALLEKESALNLREQELDTPKPPIDSTRQDTSTYFNPDILGSWNTVMTCTETTCPGSAVGDTKTETWEFSYENNYLVAKAMAGNKLVRIYSGSFTNNKYVQLKAIVEPTDDAPATRMVVRINPLTTNTMEGQREIFREGGCKIVYSLKLSR